MSQASQFSNGQYPPFSMCLKDDRTHCDTFKGTELTGIGCPNPEVYERSLLDCFTAADIRQEMRANRLAMTKSDDQMRFLLKAFYSSKLPKVDADPNSLASSDGNEDGKNRRKSSVVSAKNTKSNGEFPKKVEDAFWTDSNLQAYHGRIFEGLASNCAKITAFTKMIDEADRPKLCELMEHVAKIRVSKGSNEMRGELEVLYKEKKQRGEASGTGHGSVSGI